MTEFKLPNLDHDRYLRMAFEIARQAGEAGEHPFGCLLVGPNGDVIIEQGNAFRAEGGDMTAHAERMIATQASKSFSPDFLATCTLYTSAEPCAMCSGALYWAGVGRIVFGQSERSLKDATGSHPENPTLDLPCRAVFAAGQRAVEIIGPMLEEEAAALQTGFWKGE